MSTLYSISRTEDVKSYRQGWSQAFGTVQGQIILVPSEAEGTVFQFSPRFKISCFLPEIKRNLKLSYFKLDSRTSTHEFLIPKLILIQDIDLLGSRNSWCTKSYDHPNCNCKTCLPSYHSPCCFCGECLKTRKFEHTKSSSFSIMSYKKTETEITTSVIRFANIYDTGKLCLGTQWAPTNLRIANNNFWGSTFNNDFKLASFSHRWCINKSQHHNSAHWITPKNHTGSCRKQIAHKCDCNCPIKDKHQIDCKYNRACFCVCACPCCLGACKCFCQCDCCRKVCGCSCDCFFNEEFAEFFKLVFKSTSSAAYYPNPHIKGTQFVSTQQKIDGVFISSEAKLLKKIENNYHHKFPDGTSFIAGFSRAIADNEWEVTLEDGQVILLDTKEIAFA